VVTGSPALTSHTFYVDRLVRAHHQVSQGFETANASALGGTTITVELGDSALAKDTTLDFLNGQQGIARGSIRITDRSGATALIGLSGAVSINDVLNAINTQADANVTATVGEQGLIITDNTGQTTSNLKVENVGLTDTATSLGIAANVAADTITGSAINTVTTSTSLGALNRGLGVRSAAGVDDIRIVSSAGVVDVNVSTASTVGDVIDAINTDASNNGNLTAAVSADGLSIELTDSGGGPLNVTALNDSESARDLGLLGKVTSGGTLTGESLIPSLNSVLLRSLNGGSGVGEAVSETALDDLNAGGGVARGTMNIRDRSGASADVDLSEADTLRDVVDAINAAAVAVVATVDDDHLVLFNVSGSTTTTLRVQDVDLSTADDLGILGEEAGTRLTGSQILYLDLSSSVDILNYGNGLGTVSGSDLRIWMDATTSFDVDLLAVASISDVLNAINNASGNSGVDAVTATLSADGRSIELSGKSLDAHTPPVEMLNGSSAAADLGLLGHAAAGTIVGDVILGDLSVETHRRLGSLVVADRDGTTDVIDLSACDTLSELVSVIEAGSSEVSADVNAEGNGIEITDTSGGSSNLVLTSREGTASSLGVDTEAAGVAADSVNSSDLDLRYLSEKTRLEEMNGGQGVAAGKFRITNRQGVSAVVDLTQEDDILLEDVIEEINSRGISVTARINDTGDGLLLVDGSTGTGVLEVEEVESGTTARDLNILGEAEVSTPGQIDGSWEIAIDISDAEGLQDVADAINATNAHVSASVINDGTSYSPYRLSIVSARTGERGQIIVDPGESALSFTTVQRGQDAVVRYGSTDPGSSPVLLTSSTNAFDQAIDGLSLSVISTSTSPVEISVTRDYEYITEKLGAFAAAYNTVREQITTYTSFDAETAERGLLLGDATVQRMERALSNLIVEPVSGISGTITRLKQVGISYKTNGELRFDDETFYEQLSTNLEGVLAFFTTEDVGFAARLEAFVEEYTDPYESILTTKSDALDRNIELFNERVDHMSTILGQKEQNLIDQFTQMELVLGRLQSQSSAIQNIRTISLADYGKSSSGRTLYGS